MTTRIEELKAQQARELREAELKDRIESELASVPGFDPEDSSLCVHGIDKPHPHVSVRLWKDYQTTRKVTDALAVVEHFAAQIITCEHWKDGCVSDWPIEINSCAKGERAVMDGSHAVEIEVSGGRGYGGEAVKFWTRLAGVLVEISCPVSDLYALRPTVRGSYTRAGDFIRKSIEWPVESRCVDSFRRMYSEGQSYQGCYYLADVPNFRAWASQFIKPTVTA